MRMCSHLRTQQQHGALAPNDGAWTMQAGSGSSRVYRCEKLGVSINSGMDGGNIEVVALSQLEASAQGGVQLQARIRPDPWCETDNRAHFQVRRLCVPHAFWYGHAVLGP